MNHKKVVKIRVVTVDDHPLVRQGIVDVLEECRDIEVVGQAHSAQAAMKVVQTNSPDVVVLDIHLPDGSGLKLCEKLKKKFRNLEVIILSGYSDQAHKMQAIMAGAREYFTKSDQPEKLIAAIRQAHSKNTLFDTARAALKKTAALAQGLTPAEIDVLHAIKDGRELRAAAHLLGINLKTLQFHLSNIYSKLQVSNRNEAIYKSLQLHIISVDNP